MKLEKMLILVIITTYKIRGNNFLCNSITHFLFNAIATPVIHIKNVPISIDAIGER